MIKWIEKGDIFALDGINVYAHGCNCKGAMGKGIALQFKRKYPQMYLEYKDLCASNEFRPGDAYLYDKGDDKVFNLGTQKTWRTKATLPFIEESLVKMFEISIDKKIENIALPRIGAGLGGLDWIDVKKIIEKVAINYPTIGLIVVEEYAPSTATPE